jgi:hypothetical protein
MHYAKSASVVTLLSLVACGHGTSAGPGDVGMDAASRTDAVAPDAGVDDATGMAPVDASLDGQTPCPTKPPADLTNPDLSSRCADLLYVAGGNRSLRLTSSDLVSWANPHIDTTNCLSNPGDASTLNCGTSTFPDGGEYDCTQKNPSTCPALFDGLNCAFPDPSDPKVIDCAGFDDGAFGVAFGLGYVVVSSDFGIFTTANAGVTWTKAPAPAPQQWNQGGHVSSAAFGNGMFLVLGDDNAFKSTDGTTWTESTYTVDGGGTGYWGFHNLAYGNGHFVAVGTQRISGVDTPFVKATDDGVNWYGVITNADLSDVVFDGTRFFAVGLKGRRATSPDGVTWTTLTADDPTCTDPSTWTGNPASCLGNLTAVASGNGQYYVCGSYCALSTDGGTTWTRTKAWTYLPLFYAKSRFYDLSLQWTVDGGAWQTEPDAGPSSAVEAIGLQHIGSGLVLKGM